MFQNLPSENQFSKGSSLWIVTDPSSSLVAKEVNWSLDFTYTKSKQHKDLLVESSLMIPNRLTLFILFSSSKPEQWVHQARKHWMSLSKPSVRIFPPLPISLQMLDHVWEEEVLPYKIHVCLSR